MIAVAGLRVLFGRSVALNDVSFELSPGVVGLFGPNGSGKSTLLRVLSGLLPPTRGTVSFEGARLTLRDESLRGRIGYAGHVSGLYTRLTVAENLELFARLHDTPPRRLRRLIDSLGLEECLRWSSGDLSAGFKRRAAVARALVGDPDLLLLDEPYANLDDEAAERVTQSVLEWRGPNKLCVVATHGAKRVRSFADSGLVLRRGRLAAYGSYKERRARSG